MLGEIVTLTIVAFALGMDAFSISLGMGLIRLRLKQIAYIGIIVGIFHMIMPLVGMTIGRFLSFQFGHIASYIGGGILLILGCQMLFASLKHDDEEKRWMRPVGVGLFLFAFSVSIDSFSAGLSLGIYGAGTAVAIASFGTMSMLLTWCGLLIGRRFRRWLGTYSEALGGAILLLFACKLLFPL